MAADELKQFQENAPIRAKLCIDLIYKGIKMCKDKFFHIGTSGWHYLHWWGKFYPENYSEKELLKYYSQFYCTVEINNTFYHLPSAKIVKQWLDSVPDNFIFSVKASRYITHMKKLKDPEISTEAYFNTIRNFKDRIGVILFQLPPNFKVNTERFEKFIKKLPVDYRYTFEFRDKSWFIPDIYEIMKHHNLSLCFYSMGKYNSPKELLSDFVYLRLHGSNTLGSGLYDISTIERIAEEIKIYLKEGKEVFCYFNNDESGYAIKNALQLQGMFEK